MEKQCEKCAKSLIKTLEKLDEYERKLADGEFVSKDWHDEQVLHLQEENERLTEENAKYQEKWQTSYMNELNLQKQVDELTAKNEHLDSENTRLICEMDKMLDDGWDIMDEEADGWYKKGVKDTAKEILQTIKRAKENGQLYYNEDFMITAQKAYGVEVDK